MENQLLSESSDLGLMDGALEEAGGLLSWLRRAYTATDPKVVMQLYTEILHGVKDEQHRKDLLAEIDGFLREAEAAESGSSVHDTALNLPGLHMRKGARDAGKIRAYIASLRKVREKVAHAQLKKD